MGNKFSGIWQLRQSDQNKENQNTILANNGDSINIGETYEQYGLRTCGRVTGSHPALAPYLSKIYHEEERKQHNDCSIQENLKNQLREELTHVEGEISNKEASKESHKIKINEIENRKNDALEQLRKEQEEDGRLNKMPLIKLIIGCTILLLLTIYLFIFYGSTFYSAFLYTPNINSQISLGTAMLNASAFSEAFHLGFGAFIFVITAPIIFLGLGYSLHYFMIQKGSIKWFKIASLLFITFSFDCILAFKIGEMIYDFLSLTSFEQLPPYTVDLALKDINSWAVIFCGFIVYLIWGIVFDMVMTAYEELRSNRYAISNLRSDIAKYDSQIATLKQEIVNIEGEINTLESKKTNLINRINNSVLVDYTVIRTAIADFFAGWMRMMNALGIPPEEQGIAREIYENTTNQLFN